MGCTSTKSLKINKENHSSNCNKAQEDLKFINADINNLKKLENQNDDSLRFIEKMIIPGGELYRYKYKKSEIFNKDSEEETILVSIFFGDKIKKKDAIQQLENMYTNQSSMGLNSNRN